MNRPRPRPGGHLVVTAPDEDLCEHGPWPSRFNGDHKWSFTIHKPQSPLPTRVDVLDLSRLPNVGRAIEIMWRKRD